MPKKFSVERGDRIYLRAPQASDAAQFTASMRASRKLHSGWIKPPTSVEHFRRALALATLPENERRLIFRSEDDALVGVVNLSQIFRGPLKSAYIGYYAVLPYAKHGYTSEGVGLMLRHAFATLGLHRVEANIQPENEGSRRVAMRNGFRLEGYSPRYLKVGGRWRDHERWAVLGDAREDDPKRPAALARGLRRSLR